ncbi:tetratricopeptide repeat protein [Actinocrispum sp. NPDC049592]|uniref:tetratricopeptide repeat protein n=1 Tax=Actinocrispum sp. NPDC049592 TaxID=3154835 RepID=UPI00344710C0
MGSDGIGRATEVLLALLKAAGNPKHDDLDAQAAKSGLPSFSRSTYYDLLKGKRRSATAVDFIRLCVEYARTHPKIAELPPDQLNVGHWQDKYENALGLPAPELGQRVGPPPPQVVAYVRRAVLDDTPVQVLTGLGGVGKTQIAAAHAWERWHDPAVDLVIWVSAKSGTDIVSTYAQAAEQLLGADPKNTASAVRQLMTWLSTNSRWLIVLDDVAIPGDLRELWPPTSGQTVITTRYVGAAWDRPSTRVVSVDVFTPAESQTYLNERLGQTSDELAADLGHLPLALSHAAAYIRNTQISIDEYRELFADRKRRVADLMPVAGESPDEHTVATTWSLSVQRAEQIAPVRPLLEIAALLDHNGIPLQVFTSDSVTNAYGKDTKHTLSVAHRFSLLTFDPSTPARAVIMHALVQRVTRDGMSIVDSIAACALNEIQPNDRKLVEALFDNTKALVDNAWASVWGAEVHPVLEHAGKVVGMIGLARDAAEYFQPLLDLAAAQFGPDHPSTLTFRHEVAFWNGEAGDPAGSVGAMEALLDDRIRVLGDDHPTTLLTRHSLARFQGEAGDAAGAAATLGDVLAEQVRLLGEEDPGTLVTRANRAHFLGESGNVAEAVSEFERVLPLRVRVLGPDDRSTLMTRHNLARWRFNAGHTEAAIAEFERLLPDWQRVFGPDHVDTLLTRHELARCRGEAGDPAGALVAFQELLADLLRTLGPRHLRTLATRGMLARWQSETGDVAGAVAALEELLPDLTDLAGADHPRTKVIRERLEALRSELS